MYYILERELKKKGLTRKNISDKLGMSISTVSCKLNDHSEFTIKECKEIRELLNFNGTIDELFKTE